MDEGDAALLAGESRAALEAYRQAIAMAGVDHVQREEAVERVLALLAAGPDQTAMRREAEQQLRDRPGAIAPRLALAAVEGDARRAAGLYDEAARLLSEGGRDVEASCARGAAERLRASGSGLQAPERIAEAPEPGARSPKPEDGSLSERAQTAWREGRSGGERAGVRSAC